MARSNQFICFLFVVLYVNCLLHKLSETFENAHQNFIEPKL